MGIRQIDISQIVLGDGYSIYTVGFRNRGQNLKIISQSFKRVQLEPGSLATANSSSFTLLSKEIVNNQC